MSTQLYSDLLPGGAHWSAIIRRGQSLRISDIDGGANVALLAYAASEKTERLNLPDTLKCQHTARLGAGHCLYSDMGHVLLCIVEDTLGWHDAIGGVSNAAEVLTQFGAGDFQDLRNGFHRNGQDNLLVEIGKWGLGPRDLAMNVNFFSKVVADDAGRFAFVTPHSRAGDSVELVAPMDTLVVLTAIQHPLDSSTAYAPKPVKLSVSRVDDLDAAISLCRTSRAENARGLELTARLAL
ncbi:urea amidolyase associated protein UAAP1 [Hydrocarboniphaga sp.]|uniref:urea amidolyase associated protein UAAP1 n=1 Tax=Hydrocarboniphaga sp. TaxID=2033016 RepID=UPI003D0D2058